MRGCERLIRRKKNCSALDPEATTDGSCYHAGSITSCHAGFITESSVSSFTVEVKSSQAKRRIFSNPLHLLGNPFTVVQPSTL